MLDKLVIPPLKSQGIKTKLINWINNTVPNKDNTWIEPFLGTGVVAFNANFKQAILADSNPHIINFYLSIQQGVITPEIAKNYLLKEGDILKKSDNNGYGHFKLVRARFNTTFQPLDLLFLSRAGFNGMMRFNKKGQWNIPFCKNSNRFQNSYVTKIVNQVKNCAEIIKPSWKFFNKSFEEIIPLAKKGDVLYCDPPYLGLHTTYYNTWNESNEALLFDLLSKTSAYFILSTWHHNKYKKNSMLEKYWNNFNILTKDHFYTVGSKKEYRNQVTEALITNFIPITK